MLISNRCAYTVTEHTGALMSFNWLHEIKLLQSVQKITWIYRDNITEHEIVDRASIYVLLLLLLLLLLRYVTSQLSDVNQANVWDKWK